MKRVRIYQYSKCGTCRLAVKHLERNGYEFEIVEVFDNPPGVQELAELVGKSGLPLQKFFNTSGDVYKEMNLKDKIKGMTDNEKLVLLSSNGRLIKRPIVTDGGKVTVGYKEDTFNQTWS